MEIDKITEKYLMERFSAKSKSFYGNKSTIDKIESIAEHAVTVSIDWLNMKRGQFWNLNKNDQLSIIDKYLNTFIRKYKEDIEEIIVDKNIEKFIKNNRDELINNIRKFMYRVYGD